MSNVHFKKQLWRYRNPAFSTAELLIALSLLGVLAVLGLNLLLTAPGDTWPRMVEDYFRQLSSVYNKIKLETGDTPLNALDNTLSTPSTPVYLYPDGIASVLQTWESTKTYVPKGPSVAAKLLYPSNMVVYLDPEDTNIPDSNNQLPIHQPGALNPNSDSSSIMTGTNDHEWLLIDVNGDAGPNSLGVGGDRVLLIVDDPTGRVLTAWQKCWMTLNPGVVNPYGNSAKTTCVLGPSSTPSFPGPNRTYYKSFYDVKKDYTGSY
jgi:hypothetical protein